VRVWGAVPRMTTGDGHSHSEIQAACLCEGSVDGPRQHGVDADAVLSPCDGQALGQRQESALAGAVGALLAVAI
jgi:hypothetical protein